MDINKILKGKGVSSKVLGRCLGRDRGSRNDENIVNYGVYTNEFDKTYSLMENVGPQKPSKESGGMSGFVSWFKTKAEQSANAKYVKGLGYKYEQ